MATWLEAVRQWREGVYERAVQQQCESPCGQSSPERVRHILSVPDTHEEPCFQLPSLHAQHGFIRAGSEVRLGATAKSMN
ncbi:hypothetical protein AOLI_G00022160 [Acnodon oligacanthus]